MTDNTDDSRKEQIIAYKIGDSLYLNITNRCPNRCLFCIRETPKGVGYDLWLQTEPTVAELQTAIGDPRIYREIVFCGYGEPLLRADAVLEVAAWLKAQGAKSIRINTNGLADLFLDYDLVPKMAGLVDVISISLNAPDSPTYQEITGTVYGEKAYESLLRFAKRCGEILPKVILSAVDYPGVDLQATAAVAAELGLDFRVRKYQE